MNPMLVLLALLPLTSNPAGAQVTQQPPTGDTRSVARSLRLLDLRDLLLVDSEVPDFEEGHLGSAPSNADQAYQDRAARAAWMRAKVYSLREPSTPPTDAERVAERAVQWQSMLRLWIEPQLTPELDRLELLANGTLIAQLPAEGQAWLDRFLTLQRGERTQFTSEFRILEASKGTFDALLPAGKQDPTLESSTLELRGHTLESATVDGNGILRPGANLLTPQDVERLLTAAKSQPGVNLLMAPKLMQFTRSRANLSTYDEVAYIKEWTVEVIEPGQRSIAVPNIATVRDGLSVAVRGVQMHKGLLGLEIEVALSVVKRPLRTRTVRLDVEGGRDVEVGLPEVQSQRLRSHLALEPGRSAYFRGPSTTAGKETLVVLTVTVPGKEK